MHTFVSLLPENTCKGHYPTTFLGLYRIETHGYFLAREILIKVPLLDTASILPSLILIFEDSLNFGDE